MSCGLNPFVLVIKSLHETLSISCLLFYLLIRIKECNYTCVNGLFVRRLLETFISNTKTCPATWKYKDYLLTSRGFGKCQTSAQTDRSSKEPQTSTTTEQGAKSKEQEQEQREGGGKETKTTKQNQSRKQGEGREEKKENQNVSAEETRH